MLDLLGKEIRLNDKVVYVFANKQGKIQIKQGTVVGFNNFGARVQTSSSIITVKNVIVQKRERKLFGFINV